ncbi:MAG: hypothetical protein Q8N21_04455 [bacterium]|nr:hypothetical protein [bacterium]
MTFPLYYFLLIYLLFILLWLIFSLVAVYHMIKFSFKNFTSFFATFIFIGVSIFILMESYNYLSRIDWEMNVIVFENMFNHKLPF